MTRAAVLALASVLASPAMAADFYTVTPCRFFDTRDDTSFWYEPLGPFLWPRFYRIRGNCGIPEDATAVVLQVTTTEATAAGHITVFDGEGLYPSASAVQVRAGVTRTSFVSVAVGRRESPTAPDIAFALYLQGPYDPSPSTHVIVDVLGYFK